MTSGGQQAQDVAPGAAGEHQDALRRARGGDLLGGGLVGLERAGPDQLDREHRAPAADLRHGRHVVLEGRQPGERPRLDRPRGGRQVVALVDLERRQGRGARERVAAERAAQARPRARRRAARRARSPHRAAARPRCPSPGRRGRARRPRAPSRTSRRCARTRSAPRRRRARSRGRPPTPASVDRNPGAGTTKPPSPRIGSTTSAATWSAPTWRSATSMARSAACWPVIPAGSRSG